MLGKLARQHDPNVLVGFDYADDAGVYRIAPDAALVQTVDFFTPIVDDPYTFGQIAATNSLSDVYAMGGRPITALAMVCFPEKGDLAILERILAGGLSKMMEANCTVIGGHSIRDDETKFGYSVTGMIDPARVLANKGAQPGDRLLFTKALGTGVIATAIKKGAAKPSWIDAAVKSMTALNKTAAEVVTGFAEADKNERVGADAFVRPAERSSATSDQQPTTGNDFAVHALTDITGFGMIGHAREMAIASEVSITLYANRIPFLDGAMECIRAGHIPGGLKANREFAECTVEYAESVPEELKTILYDPQTAGGLFVAVNSVGTAALLKALQSAGVSAVEIGEVTSRTKPLIMVCSDQ